MGETQAADLLKLDRDVARAVRAWRSWTAALAHNPAEHATHDPIAPLRHTAGKSTWDALRALTPGPGESLLRDALVPWVGALTLARLTRDETIEQAEASAAAVGRYDGDPVRMVSWRDAWRALPAARTVPETARWLDAAASAAEGIASVAARHADKRMELARRLDLAHPWDVAGAAPADSVRAWARKLLDTTEDLARALQKDGAHAVVGAPELLHAAVGRDAPEGWPARLTTRWLEDVVAVPVAGLEIDLPPLPAVLGASSFARGLRAFGFALHEAWLPASRPFAIGHEPGFRASHRFGFVLGALVTNPEWHVRALGVTRRTAMAQSRVLSSMQLLETRLSAARLLLGDDASPAPRDRFDELGPRLFGARLDSRLRGAWPAPRDDEPARLVARIESLKASDELRDRFDVDWFRNPRAWTHLRSGASSSAGEPMDVEGLPPRIEALARALEVALG